jgi:serine/threonine-protein kinase
MATEPSVPELVSRWQELRRQGKAVSPEELCADCLGRLGELKRHLQAVASMASFLSPADTPPGDASALTPTRAANGSAPCPGIPGYEVLGVLGRGGMGVVYHARQAGLNRPVALKMILAGAHAGDDDRQRFLTEAVAVARLQHPNIVQIHEIGEADGQPFFSLELCPGGSLATKLAGTPLPPTKAARLGEVLARAVQAAHEAGIVHRDLKPANVLLTADGTPKVTDFGLAKKLDAAAGQTASGAIVGTPSYMAPEQAGGKAKEVGPAADVYALGAILYECLTGRPPFKAATAFDTVLQVLSEEPVPPGRLQPGLPRDLETICVKCLQKEQRKRYATAAQLANDLRRFQAGEPIRARRVGRLERGWKWARRNPAVAGLATAAGAALLLVVVALAAGLAAVNAERARTAAANANLTAEQEKTQAAYQAEARRRRQAREALDAMSSEVIDDWLTRQKELSESQKAFLKKALASYEEFARDTGEDAEARAGVAGAYLRTGKIRWALGQAREAEEAFAKAREQYGRLAAEFPDHGELRHALAQCHRSLGVLLERTRRAKAAEGAYRDALAVFKPLAAESPSRTDVRRNLATTHTDLATLLVMTDRPREAEAEFRAAAAVQEGLVADFADRPELRGDLGGTRYSLAQLFVTARRWDEAEAALRAGLALEKPLVSRFPTRTDYRQVLGLEYAQLGLVLQHTRRPAEAEEAYRKALPLLKQLANDFPSRPDYQNLVVGALGGLADVVLDKDAERARRLLEEAVPFSQAALQADPGDVDYLAAFYENRMRLVPVLLHLKDHAGAAEVAESVEQALHTPDAVYDLARQYAYRVLLAQEDPKLAGSGRKEVARKYGDRAVAALRRAVQYGYRDLANLKKESVFDPLRGRADFQKLLADLEAVRRPAKTPDKRGR